MSGNHADAEDALGAALLRAAEVFPRRAHVIIDKRAWLSRLLRNICIDIHRARRRFACSVLAEEPASGECAPGHTPEEDVLHQELRAQLAKSLDTLPVTLREPFRMRFEQGLPYDEIAASMGLTSCNARKRVQLSYKHLRGALAPGTRGRCC